jgi:C4-dicarboxylate-specific signal transduction histidine kinase
MEIYFRHPRRSEGRWAQVTARPLKDGDGGVSGAVAVLVDVTERRRMEAHLQAHRAELGRFGRLVLGAEIASTTAHQLSQPLGALCNYAGAALRLHQQGRLRESELGEMLERIERLSARAGAILDRLRARIRRSDTPPRPFDVDAVVTSCLDFLGDRIQREGVRLERRPGAGLPPVLGDPLQLEHALIQLVANALEAMEKMDRGQRRLTLATNHDPKAGVVTIEVADTGPGVSAALVDRLFLPWETDKPGSLGIGLTIVETIIEAFGGRIHMEPGASRGTRFFIELPVIVGGPA